MRPDLMLVGGLVPVANGDSYGLGPVPAYE